MTWARSASSTPAGYGLTVGAENPSGTGGAEIGVAAAGSPPTSSYRITTTPGAPGETFTYTLTILGVDQRQPLADDVDDGDHGGRYDHGVDGDRRDQEVGRNRRGGPDVPVRASGRGRRGGPSPTCQPAGGPVAARNIYSPADRPTVRACGTEPVARQRHHRRRLLVGVRHRGVVRRVRRRRRRADRPRARSPTRRRRSGDRSNASSNAPASTTVDADTPATDPSDESEATVTEPPDSTTGPIDTGRSIRDRSVSSRRSTSPSPIWRPV